LIKQFELSGERVKNVSKAASGIITWVCSCVASIALLKEETKINKTITALEGQIAEVEAELATLKGN